MHLHHGAWFASRQGAADSAVRLAVAAIALWIAAGACQRSVPDAERSRRDTGVHGALAARIDAHLTQAADSAFNGTALVATADGIILHKAYGWADTARTRPVTLDTPFWIASISKQFAAAAILELAEQGRLALGDSLPRFLAAVPADKRPITLHHLLTHTAGLVQRYAADGVAERDAAIRALLEPPLASAPGDTFAYSNDAYNLIAAIVEIVAGQPYETYLRQQLLEPAGLTHTGFWGPLDHPQVAAILYGDFANSRILQPNWGYRGGVGMFSTAADLYRWQQALERNAVLTETSRKLLVGPHRTRGSLGIGYGWFVSTSPRGTPCVWTRGYEDFGHGAVLATYPEDHAVIVVTSNAGARARGTPVSHALAQEIAALVFASP